MMNLKFSLARVSIVPLFFLGFVALSCRESSLPGAALPIQITRVVRLLPMTAPRTETVWTATNEIRDLQSAPDGLWAATAGGVLRFDGKNWVKWTKKDGLPSNESLRIEVKGDLVTACSPTAAAARIGGEWKAESLSVTARNLQKRVWRGRVLRVSPEAVQWGKIRIPLPSGSSGTHFTAALPQSDGKLLTAIFGDGLWKFDGAHWSRVFPNLPAEAREITALAGDGTQMGKSLWVGTRHDGIFRHRNGLWTRCVQPNEPFSHNIQALAQFQGVLWASTLDDGLVCRNGTGWSHFSTPILSSSAPRQMLVWKNRLYVRHGDGKVDSFDGAAWTPNALAQVPRAGVYALAGDEKRLMAAGWGGWSEWDGAKWTPHFDLSQLQGVPVLGLLPDGEDVWVATQSRGLGRWNRTRGEFRWFDERDGLRDDWITALAKIDGKIYAGSFVGGLARLDGEKWHVFSLTEGQNVTALSSDGRGGVLAATRQGMWRVKGESVEKAGPEWLDSEQQALLTAQNGVWVGSRTSLSFISIN